QANDLAGQGKPQSEIARTLGECHDLARVAQSAAWASACTRGGSARSDGQGGGRMAELQLENSRLRRLGTDLLHEKIKLEEATQRTKVFGVRGRRRASR